MKVLVTGAGGFLGRAVVKAAADAGHEVIGLYRPTSVPDAARLPMGVTALSGDLRQRGSWIAGIGGIDAVIHCAAAFGDLPSQLAGTVLATENLLDALPASAQHFVHISSFSVHDFEAPGWSGRFDESTPLEGKPLRRDAYTQTKLMQERLVLDACAASGRSLVVIRPGAIYGPGKDWDCGRAMGAGPFDLIFAPFARMRLVHVTNCADAIVKALSVDASDPLIVHLVDDEQPGHWRFHRMARKAGARTGVALPVPYGAVLALGWSARIASKLFFKGMARLPEFLDLPRQKVRWRPLRYSNAKARAALGWQPSVSLADALTSLLPDESENMGTER